MLSTLSTLAHQNPSLAFGLGFLAVFALCAVSLAPRRRY